MNDFQLMFIDENNEEPGRATIAKLLREGWQFLGMTWKGGYGKQGVVVALGLRSMPASLHVSSLSEEEVAELREQVLRDMSMGDYRSIRNALEKGWEETGAL